VRTPSFTADLSARTATTAAGAQVHLTPTEWHLLDVLARQPGRLVAQLDLLRAVWGSAKGEESRHYLRVIWPSCAASSNPTRRRPVT
jgi:two-component system KDP operon response regulator KdpE